MADIIRTEHLYKSFKNNGNTFEILKDINISVEEGKLTILKGRSGSGKTTLMNILGTLDEPTSGEIILNGKKLSELSEKEKEKVRRTSLGFIFQSVALIPMMTAGENVEFALRMAGYDGDIHERAMHCLKLVGLGNKAKHMPAEMSGGEQQRVAIARAIAHKPIAIFADEPTAELDSQTALGVIRLFKEMVKDENLTILMTTHDTGIMHAGDVSIDLESINQ